MATSERAFMADVAADLYFFDRSHLAGLARDHAAAYQSADPYPHIVIDDFLPTDVLKEVIAEFPGPRALDWQRYDVEQEVKLATDDTESLPPFTRHLLSELNSAPVIDFLEQMTGIDGLIPDPHYWGGGLHQIEPGGRLKIHSDFNWHEKLRLDRRLNLLIYLNEDWEESWGGHLELWNRDMSACVEKVAPIANRCVVFSTTDFSFHGHPDPLACPPGRTRQSLALYYYSNGRPAAELSTARTTAFKPRPGEQWRRGNSRRTLVERWLPPALVDGARRAAQPRQGVRSLAMASLTTPTAPLMGIEFDLLTEQATIDHVLRQLDDGSGGWLMNPNVDVLRQLTAEPELAALAGEADLVIADGMPLLWALRAQGVDVPERVAGSSLIWTLTAAAARAGRSVFLLGGAPGVADQAASRLVDVNPGLVVAGTACPPMGFEQDDTEIDRIVEAVRGCGADIVFCGFGFPKQERLIVRLREALPTPWFIATGASIAMVAGEHRRAPRWMQDAGLEWLYRLGQEPRRLFRRYVIDDMPFAARLAGHVAGERRHGGRGQR